MKNKDFVSEAELHAYVDQQLPESRKKVVEEWLSHHPEDVKRINRWKLLNQSLKINFDKEELIPPRLNPKVLQAKLRSKRRVLVKPVLLIFIGFLVGWFSHLLFGFKKVSDITLDAIAAHKVFVVEKNHPVEIGFEREEYLVNWLSKRLDYELRLPHLNSLGYKLMGGRLLSVNNGPAAQFMYQNNKKQRITLFVTRSEKNYKKDASLKNNKNINSSFVFVGNIGYVITGSTNKEEFKVISKYIFNQILELSNEV